VICRPIWKKTLAQAQRAAIAGRSRVARAACGLALATAEARAGRSNGPKLHAARSASVRERVTQRAIERLAEGLALRVHTRRKRLVASQRALRATCHRALKGRVALAIDQGALGAEPSSSACGPTTRARRQPGAKRSAATSAGPERTPRGAPAGFGRGPAR